MVSYSDLLLTRSFGAGWTGVGIRIVDGGSLWWPTTRTTRDSSSSRLPVSKFVVDGSLLWWPTTRTTRDSSSNVLLIKLIIDS